MGFPYLQVAMYVVYDQLFAYVHEFDKGER